MPRPKEIGQPSWPAILAGVIEKSHRHINKAEPGRVVAYDVDSQTATVQPVVQHPVGPYMQPGEYETVPPLLDVPVIFPGGAAGFLHVPLKPGDSVLLVYCDEDPSLWLNTGSISPPQIQNRHGLHPVAIPGLVPEVAVRDIEPGDHVTLTATSELRLGATDATDPIALEPGVAAVLGDIVTELTTMAAALVPTTGVDPAAKAAFATNMLAIAARVTAGEMAATKVKAK